MRCLRLKKRKEIGEVFHAGKRAHAKTVTIVYRPSKALSFAVCVGKKYGKSVQRNRVKRLLREAFRCYQGEIITPCAFLLIPKVAEEYSFAAFRRDLKNLLEREKLIEHKLESADRAQ